MAQDAGEHDDGRLMEVIEWYEEELEKTGESGREMKACC